MIVYYNDERNNELSLGVIESDAPFGFVSFGLTEEEVRNNVNKTFPVLYFENPNQSFFSKLLHGKEFYVYSLDYLSRKIDGLVFVNRSFCWRDAT